MKYEKQISDYLSRENFIKINVTKDEIEGKKFERYYELFEYLEKDKELSKKFFSKMAIFFLDYPEEKIWFNKNIEEFIKTLNKKCPYLFFYAEKEQGTLKILTIFECATGIQEGDNIALDKEKFNKYFQKQIVNLIIMSEKVGIPLEQTEASVKNVCKYFALW